MVECMMTQEFGKLNVRENFLDVAFFLIELLGKSFKFYFIFLLIFFQTTFYRDHTCQAPEHTKKYFTNTRGVTVHVFVPENFRYGSFSCVPHVYRANTAMF